MAFVVSALRGGRWRQEASGTQWTAGAANYRPVQGWGQDSHGLHMQMPTPSHKDMHNPPPRYGQTLTAEVKFIGQDG